MSRMPPALVAVLALLPAACGPEGPAAARIAPALSIAFPVPANQTGQLVGVQQAAANLNNEGLVHTDRFGRHQPQLAQSWRVDAGRRRVTIELRPDLRFPDGSRLDAAAVVASLARTLRTPQQLMQYPMLRDIAAVSATGERHVVLQLSRPSALLLDNLYVPIRRELGDKRLVGPGAFFSDGSAGGVIRMRANPHYYRGAPLLSRVEFRTFPSVRTAWASLMRGENDVLYDLGEARDFVEQDSSLRVVSFLRPFTHLLIFNMRRPLFGASPALRVALNLAVDRDAVIEGALKGRGVASSGIWPRHWAYPADGPAFAYDARAADALLTSNGHARPSAARDRRADRLRMPSRLRFACLVPAQISVLERIALVVQRQLYALGIDMHIEAVPVQEFIRRITAGEYDVALTDLIGGFGLSRAYETWHSTAGGQAMSFGYHGADTALDRLRSAATEDDTRRAVRDILQAFHDDPPAVFLCWPEAARVVSRRFSGPMEDGRDPIGSVWGWRLN